MTCSCAKAIDAVVDAAVGSLLHGAIRSKRRSPIRFKRPPDIRGMQIAYFKKLKLLVKDLIVITEENVIPYLSEITHMANMRRPDRMDDFTDQVEDLIRKSRSEFGRRWSDVKIAEIASEAGYNVNRLNSKYYFEALKKIAGVGVVSAEPWLEQEFKGFVKNNVRLISTISDDHFNRVEGVIMQGAQSGKLGKDIAVEIKSKFGIAENKAALIARDQVSKFNSNLTMYRQKEAGIEKYRWSTSGDERVRAEHAANEGQIFNWNEPPSTGHPGEDINCRCVAIPVIQSEE